MANIIEFRIGQPVIVGPDPTAVTHMIETLGPPEIYFKTSDGKVFKQDLTPIIQANAGARRQALQSLKKAVLDALGANNLKDTGLTLDTITDAKNNLTGFSVVVNS